MRETPSLFDLFFDAEEEKWLLDTLQGDFHLQVLDSELLSNNVPLLFSWVFQDPVDRLEVELDEKTTVMFVFYVYKRLLTHNARYFFSRQSLLSLFKKIVLRKTNGSLEGIIELILSRKQQYPKQDFVLTDHKDQKLIQEVLAEQDFKQNIRFVDLNPKMKTLSDEVVFSVSGFLSEEKDSELQWSSLPEQIPFLSEIQIQWPADNTSSLI